VHLLPLGPGSVLRVILLNHLADSIRVVLAPEIRYLSQELKPQLR
jgi:hypothetical protein